MKVALVINDNFTMWQFRRGIIKELVRKGVEVHVITPPGDYTERLESLGTTHHSVPMDRFINPLNDLLTTYRLFRIFRTERFDVVHNMQAKPLVFGTVAAALAGVPTRVVLVAGLGYPFFIEDPNVVQRMLGQVVSRLVHLGCRLSHRAWIQNEDDLKLMVERGFLTEDKTVLIRGSGVNLQEFSPSAGAEEDLRKLREELDIPDNRCVVTLIVARIIWSKGIQEFVEAARILEEKNGAVTLLLVGPYEPRHPDSVPRAYLEGTHLKNLRVFPHLRDDIRDILAISDVVVLPSYFREGVPRVLIEALAMSKPIITTDRPGCREVVDEAQNGYLIQEKDPKALAAGIRDLAADSAKRVAFGEHSYQKARNEFDEAMVVRRVLTELYRIT